MQRRKMRGFSLVEVMIIILIFGILAVLTVPAFVKWKREQDAAHQPAVTDTVEYLAADVAEASQPPPCDEDDIRWSDPEGL